MSNSFQSQERFTDRVENYVRFRPTYPPEVIDFLCNELGLSAVSIVADVGSGTGIFSRLLLERGCKVFGIEPNATMRVAAEQAFASDFRFTSLEGTAEHTSLPDQSVDFITAAQAFHWFDVPRTRREFARILRPTGWGVLIWNDRRLTGTPFLDGYERALQVHGIDYQSVSVQSQRATEKAAIFFDPGTGRERTFENSQTLSQEAFLGRVLSSSYVPNPSHPGYSAMLQEMNRFFDDCQEQGHVRFEYDVRVFYGRVS